MELPTTALLAIQLNVTKGQAADKSLTSRRQCRATTRYFRQRPMSSPPARARLCISTFLAAIHSQRSQHRVYRHFPGCNPFTSKSVSRSGLPLCIQSAENRQRTLSNPAMFLFSAKNSAGDFCSKRAVGFGIASIDWQVQSVWLHRLLRLAGGEKHGQPA